MGVDCYSCSPADEVGEADRDALALALAQALRESLGPLPT